MPCKKLTLKQRDFAKKAVEYRNSTEAAMQVYNCKSRVVAANMACRLHKNPKIKDELERLLVDVDISADKVMQRVAEGLDANTVVKFNDTGDIIQTDVPDLPTRHKYVETAARILEMNPSTKIETRTVNIDLQLEKMNKQQIEAFAKGFFNTLHGQGTRKFANTSGAGEETETITSPD